MKSKTRLMSLVVTLAIILSSMIFVVPTSVAAADPVEAWATTDASAALEGEGTAENPYLIATPADFIKFVTDLPNLPAPDPEAPTTTTVYKLADNIDLTAKDWTIYSQMTASRNFELIGDNKTISVDFKTHQTALCAVFGILRGGHLHDFTFDCKVSTTTTKTLEFWALFANRTYGTKLENIVMDFDIPDLTFSEGNSALKSALVIGYATWDGTTTTQLINVTLTGNATISSNKTADRALTFGGYAGRLNTATFENCVADIDFTFNRPIASSTVNRVGIFSGATQSDANTPGIKFIGCVNKANMVSDDKANAGRSGTWLGQIPQGGSVTSISFENCVDATTWYQSKGAKHAVIGFNDTYTADKLTVNGFFSASATLIAGGKTTQITANNVLNPIDACYEVMANDKINVYINLAIWNNIAAGTYPVKLAVAYNGATINEPVLDASKGVAVFTFDVAEEEGVLPQLAYSSTAGVELINIDVTVNKPSWTTFAATEFASVEGKVIEIATASQLALLAVQANNGNDFSGYTINLTADIDLAGYEWTPIWPSHTGGFAGVIDGKGNSIKNMTLTADSYEYTASFIGRTAGKFAIQNVNFVDPVIAPGDVKGSINAVCTVVGGFYAGTIDNVHVTGLDLTTIPTESGGYIGGMVGYLGMYTAVLKNSSVAGLIHGTVGDGDNAESKMDHQRIGGLVARSRYGFVENCVVNVNIDLDTNFGLKPVQEAMLDGDGNPILDGDDKPIMQTVYKNSRNLQIGGVVGHMEANGCQELTKITNVTVNSNINVDLANSGIVNIGGIVGNTVSSKGADDILYVDGLVNNSKITYNNTDESEAIFNVGTLIGNLTIDGAVLVNVTDNGTGADVKIANMAAPVVYAENDDFVTTLDGARLRLDVGTDGEFAFDNSGLRFDSVLNKAVYDAFAATGATVDVGTMIVPVDLIGEKTAAELYADANILKVANTKELTNGKFNGAIVNLAEGNYGRDFIAISYMVVNVGTSATDVKTNAYLQYFSDFDVTDENRVRNAGQIAEWALADGEANYTEDQLAMLEYYLEVANG